MVQDKKSDTQARLDNKENLPSKSSAKKKNRWNTKTLVIVAVFVALGVVSTFIEIPIMPAAPWLKYDPSGAVALISSFVFGPLTGAVVATLTWLPRIVTNPIGSVMNIVSAIAIAVPAGLIYKKSRTMSRAISGLTVGIIFSLCAAIALNFIATPLFMGGSAKEVAALLIPAIIPFNTIKLLLNCAITLLLYKTVSKLVHGDTAKKEKNLQERRKKYRMAAESLPVKNLQDREDALPASKDDKTQDDGKKNETP